MKREILMQNSTAIWLSRNTALSMEQIADFCGLHVIEVSGLKNKSPQNGMMEFDPVSAEILSMEEIERCEKNPKAKLESMKVALLNDKKRNTRSSAKRKEAPDAALWLISKYPFIKDTHVARLVGSTKTLVSSIRDKSYRGYTSIRPKHPVVLGLCKQEELDEIIERDSPK